MVIDFDVTKYFTNMFFFADILSGIKNNGKKKKRFVVCFLYHGELLQLVLILVHFVSKDLYIKDNF